MAEDPLIDKLRGIAGGKHVLTGDAATRWFRTGYRVGAGVDRELMRRNAQRAGPVGLHIMDMPETAGHDGKKAGRIVILPAFEF